MYCGFKYIILNFHFIEFQSKCNQFRSFWIHHFSHSIILNYFALQRWRRICCNNIDKSRTPLYGKSVLDATSNFQIIMWNWCEILSIRSANMFHEVRLMDIWWWPGKCQVASNPINIIKKKIRKLYFKLKFQIKLLFIIISSYSIYKINIFHIESQLIKINTFNWKLETCRASSIQTTKFQLIIIIHKRIK